MDLDTLKTVFTLIGILIGAAVATGVGVWRVFPKLKANESNVDALQGDVRELKQSNVDLRTELNAVRAERDIAREEARQREAEARAQAERLEGMGQQLRRVEDTAREVERTNAYLRGRIDMQTEIYQKQLSDLQSTVATLKTALDSERTENATLKQQVDNLAAQVRERDDQLVERDRKILTLQRQVGELQQQLEAMKVQRQADQAEAERRSIGRAMGVVSEVAELQLKAEEAAKGGAVVETAKAEEQA